MAETLTKADWALILESLTYTRRAFEEYRMYPSYDFKQTRIKEVTDLIARCRALKKEAL